MANFLRTSHHTEQDTISASFGWNAQ